MAAEEDAAERAERADGSGRNINAAIRNAKKAARPVKITEALPKPKPKAASKKSGAKGKVGGGKRRSAFDDAGTHEGMRAKPVKVNLAKKGKGNMAKGKGKKAGKK